MGISLGTLAKVEAVGTYSPARWVWFERFRGKLYVFTWGIGPLKDVLAEPTLIPSISKAAIEIYQRKRTEEAYTEALPPLLHAFGPLFMNQVPLFWENALVNPDILSRAFPAVDKGGLKNLAQKASLVGRGLLYQTFRKFFIGFLNPEVLVVAVYSRDAFKEKIEYIAEGSGQLLNADKSKVGSPKLLTSDIDKVLKIAESDDDCLLVIGELIELYDFLVRNIARFVLEEDTQGFTNLLFKMSLFSAFVIESEDRYSFLLENVSSAFTFRTFHLMATRGIKPKTCSLCGKVFVPNRRDQIYCSSQCRRLAYMQRKHQEDT